MFSDLLLKYKQIWHGIKPTRWLIKIQPYNRFVSKATDKCLTFFKVLKRVFEWMDECQRAFQDLKTYLTTAPLLSPFVLGEELYLYLAVTPHAVSSALIREEGKV